MNKSRAWIVEIFNPQTDHSPATWRIIRTDNNRHPTVKVRDRMVLHLAITAFQKHAARWPEATFRLRNVKRPDQIIMGDILLNLPSEPLDPNVTEARGGY